MCLGDLSRYYCSMCTDMFLDMHAHICINMCTTMCIRMHVDMHIDMCLDICCMCSNMFAEGSHAHVTEPPSQNIPTDVSLWHVV